MQFNERYTISLDIGGGFFEIFPDIKPFKKSLHDEELFKRIKWGEVTIRNNPLLYSQTSSDSYRPYDLIKDLDDTQEIQIKLESENSTIVGYFGNNDCDYDDNENGKFLTVTPTILDQYTEVLENYEKDIDIIGVRKNTKATYEIVSDDLYLMNHNLPLVIKSSDNPSFQNPERLEPPNAGGAFLETGLTAYKSNISVNINASITISSGGGVSYYLREYDSNNVLLQEDLLINITSTGNVYNSFYWSPVLSKNSYVTLECEVVNWGSDEISYNSGSLICSLESIPFETVTIDVVLLGANLVAKQVWTEKLHGRSSPKEKEWTSVSDFFELDGSPKEQLFQDPEFGPQTKGGVTFSNGLDINGEPIGSTNLVELEGLLGVDEFGYELSSVTVWEGLTYRDGWFGGIGIGTKRRRVFGTCTFSREQYWKIDDGEDPPGEGWYKTDVIQSGKTLYVRKPFNGSVTDWNLGTVDNSGGNNGFFEWESNRTSIRNYPDGDGTRTFDSVRTLKDTLKTIYNNMSDVLANKEVYSTFFFNDNEGDLPVLGSYPSGTNYVTFTPNELNRLGLIHTADFNTEDTEINKDGQRLLMSLSDAISELRKYFPIYWFVDADYNLHLEHISYLDLTAVSLDISTNPLLDETLKWKYEKGKMFEKITFEYTNSGYVDFTNSLVEFPKIASNKRGQDIKLEIKSEIISTDVKYCAENPTDLNNGAVLIAYDTSNKMINDYVPILGDIAENGLMAISNLLNKYWKYEGVANTGKINNIDSEFVQTSRTKSGEPFSLKDIYDTDNGNQIEFLTTNIGSGLIKDETFDFDRGITTDITLLYRRDSDPVSDVFELIAADGVLYDFGNY